MLRVSDRGIPPHMLHLYDTDAGKSSKPQLSGNVTHNASLLARFGDQILNGLSALRSNAETDSFLPESAKRTNP